MARTSLPTIERYFEEPHPFLTSLGENFPEKPELSFIEYINKYGPYKPWATEKQYDEIIGRDTSVDLIYQHLARSSHICIEKYLRIYILDENLILYKEGEYHSRCHINERFTFIPVILSFYTSKPKGKEYIREHTGHSNIILIDNYYREIELFDPNGYQGYTWRVSQFFKGELLKAYPTYSFIPLSEYCPATKSKRIGGICAAFSLLFFWTRLYDPSLSSKDVINQLNNMRSRELNIFMDKFIHYIYDYAKNFHITEIWDLYLYHYDILCFLEEKLLEHPNIQHNLYINLSELSDLNDKYLYDFDLRGLEKFSDKLLELVKYVQNTIIQTNESV